MFIVVTNSFTYAADSEKSEDYFKYARRTILLEDALSIFLQGKRFEHVRPAFQILPEGRSLNSELVQKTLDQVFAPTFDRSILTREELLDVTFLSALYYLFTEDPKYFLITLEPDSREIDLLFDGHDDPNTMHVGLTMIDHMGYTGIHLKRYADYNPSILALYQLLNKAIESRRLRYSNQDADAQVEMIDSKFSNYCAARFVRLCRAAMQSGQLAADKEFEDSLFALLMTYLCDPQIPMSDENFRELSKLLTSKWRSAFIEDIIATGWYHRMWETLMASRNLSENQKTALNQIKQTHDQELSELLEKVSDKE